MFIKPVEEYGNVIIDKVYCYYDRPVLFVASSDLIIKKHGDFKLFVMLVEEDERSEMFLVATVYKTRLKQLEDCNITIRDFILQECWLVDLVRFYYLFDIIEIKHMWDKYSIPECHLPLQGIYLK